MPFRASIPKPIPGTTHGPGDAHVSVDLEPLGRRRRLPSFVLVFLVFIVSCDLQGGSGTGNEAIVAELRKVDDPTELAMVPADGYVPTPEHSAILEAMRNRLEVLNGTLISYTYRIEVVDEGYSITATPFLRLDSLGRPIPVSKGKSESLIYDIERKLLDPGPDEPYHHLPPPPH